MSNLISRFGYRRPFLPEKPDTITRWINGDKVVIETSATPFDSARAKEILHSGHCGDLDSVMTDGEIAFTRRVWQRMAGNTCFYDAICRIYQNRIPEGLQGQEMA